MSLLDDAQRLIEPTVEGAYVYCGGRVIEGHRTPCDLAAVPQIVVALEALQEIANGGETPDASLARAALKGDA